jgi:hypothetical protein
LESGGEGEEERRAMEGEGRDLYMRFCKKKLKNSK